MNISLGSSDMFREIPGLWNFFMYGILIGNLISYGKKINPPAGAHAVTQVDC